jgi:hypothetical protein
MKGQAVGASPADDVAHQNRNKPVVSEDGRAVAKKRLKLLAKAFE